MNALNGILVIDKPLGITSHDVVARIRKVLHTKKVGHAGTLDPEASGVLVLGINRGTRLMQYFVGDNKRYQATIRLGVSTVSDDAAGEVLQITGNSLSESEIRTSLLKFVGKIMQRPSSVSAIKVNGVRAHDLVRSGVEVELKSRPVEIFEINLLDVSDNEFDGIPVTDITVEVFCTSGTYVRALARDLGEQLNVGGSVLTLRRTQAGSFIQSQATPLSEIVDSTSVLPMGAIARKIMPTISIPNDKAIDLIHGRQINVTFADHYPVAALTSENQLVAVGKINDNVFQPDNVFLSLSELINE